MTALVPVIEILASDTRSKCISKLMESRPVEGSQNVSCTLVLYSPKDPEIYFQKRKKKIRDILQLCYNVK